MSKEFNYISDEALEQLIAQVEQDELVAAPPDLMEYILEALEPEGEPLEESVQYAEPMETKVLPVAARTTRKKEFYAYCFRVITSVAAAIVLVFLLPELTEGMEEKKFASSDFIQTVYRQEIPAYEDVVAPVPDKAEVVAAKTIPSKEEVLNKTGLLERVLRNTDWFSKEKNEK